MIEVLAGIGEPKVDCRIAMKREKWMRTSSEKAEKNV
jgi:hypothetical protein